MPTITFDLGERRFIMEDLPAGSGLTVGALKQQLLPKIQITLKKPSLKVNEFNFVAQSGVILQDKSIFMSVWQPGYSIQIIEVERRSWWSNMFRKKSSQPGLSSISLPIVAVPPAMKAPTSEAFMTSQPAKPAVLLSRVCVELPSIFQKFAAQKIKPTAQILSEIEDAMITLYLNAPKEKQDQHYFFCNNPYKLSQAAPASERLALAEACLENARVLQSYIKQPMNWDLIIPLCIEIYQRIMALKPSIPASPYAQGDSGFHVSVGARSRQ